MSDKPKRPPMVKFMTPLGTLVYPKLNTPDEYKGKKTYKAFLRVPAEDLEKFIEQYETIYAENFANEKAKAEERLATAKPGPEKVKAKKALEALVEGPKGYEVVLDDDGNETDEILLKIKMAAEYEKDGVIKKLKPIIFDSKGKALKTVPMIYGGTKVYISGVFNPYNTAAAGAGVGLRLEALQLIELNSGGGSRDASGYGFGSQGGGYEGEESGDDHGFDDQSGGDSEGGDPRPDPEDF